MLAETGEPGRDQASTRSLSVAALNERLAEVSFGLSLLQGTFAALMRISLASGTGSALLSFLMSSEPGPFVRVLRLGLAAGAGLIGAGSIAAIGRAAAQRARSLREAWDQASREVGKALGASLDGVVSATGPEARVRRSSL